MSLGDTHNEEVTFDRQFLLLQVYTHKVEKVFIFGGFHGNAGSPKWKQKYLKGDVKKKHDSNVTQVCIFLRVESRNVIYGFKNSIKITFLKQIQTHFYKPFWVWHHKRLFRCSLLRICKNKVTLLMCFFSEPGSHFLQPEFPYKQNNLCKSENACSKST